MLDSIRSTLETHLSTGYSGEVVYDNTRTIGSGAEWVRPSFVPSLSENAALGNKHVRHFGLFILQIFTKKDAGSGAAYSLGDQLRLLFTNKDFPDVRCYAAEMRRIGDTGDGWFQVNVLVNWNADEFI